VSARRESIFRVTRKLCENAEPWHRLCDIGGERPHGRHNSTLLITMKTIPSLSAAVFSLSLLAGCHSASRTEKSAAIGAATGAVIGGVIGNQSGDPRTGAAIGAAAGAVAGGAYGHSQDRRALSANDTDDYYMSLMTPDEIDILRSRARASGRTSYQLTDFLTADERANLRRRDRERTEIGR
jgi:hypothetical protein